VAHEIRNPLTVMTMLYHSLDLKFPAKDPRTKDARLMSEKIEHLNKIVERILDFARTTEPNLSPVDLNELVEELSLLVRHKLANQGVKLVCTLQPDLPSVMGDATQLEQAFLNLILNAAEAMPAGGQLSITTRIPAPGRKGAKPANVVVEFTDSGEGMTEEQCRRAFGSVLSTTKAKGTGLGLAIVGRTIETHGGTVTINSRVGHGTTFEITIPV
jgi:signal transduction histidine kinase